MSVMEHEWEAPKEMSLIVKYGNLVGVKDGLDEGTTEAIVVGLNDGFDEGTTEAIMVGLNDGNNVGNAEGNRLGGRVISTTFIGGVSSCFEIEFDLESEL